jgi:hypothetical protein
MSPTYYEDELITGTAVAPPSPPDWLQLGDFGVSIGIALTSGERRLQTRVYDSHGNVHQLWDGVDPAHLSAWISERARTLLPGDLDTPRAPRLQLSQLQVTAAREGILRLSGHLELDADPVTVESASIEVFLTNLDDGVQRSVAAETGELACYRIFAVEFALPAPGRYRVTVQARLLKHAQVKIESAGPVIRVE